MSRARTVATLLLLAVLVAPASAAAHHGDGELTAAQRHRAADLAGVSVDTLERRVNRIARRLGYRPGTRLKNAARAHAVGDPGTVGSWSGVIPAPVVPIFSALLPSGKILMWDSVGDNPAESYTTHNFTRAAVYDPVTNTSKRVDVSGYNIFCAGFVQLANGNVFVAGGNLDSGLNGIRQTHVFDWRTETWSRGPDMQDGRWYPSVASLPNDEALIIGGGPTTAEVRTVSGGLRRLTGFTTPSSREYPWMQAIPDGRTLLLGPPTAMSLIDPDGVGALTAAGSRDSIARGYGSYANFDIGRFLVAGGGNVSEDGLTGVPTRTARVIDTRSGAPVSSATGSLITRRRQHQLTVLADGSVLATGGQKTNGGGGLVDLANPSYTAERWDPATGAWTELAPAAVARQYHSMAMLLPDGRVLTGGGGICGACQTAGYLRRDFEVFTPPYLYVPGGGGALAPRPTISGAPATLGYDRAFTLTSPEAASIRKLALVRLGAPTHSEDQSQRYVPLPFTVSGTTITATAPNNPNEAPAGHYMLFAVDAAGVPSVAPIVSLQRPVVTAPAAVNLALGRTATGSAACAADEGPAKAVNGSVSGGPADKFCTKVSSTRYLRVDLGSRQAVTTFVVKHAGAGGESSALNTRSYRIQTRTRTSGSWSTALTVTGNTANVTTSTVAARTARQVRLVITQSEQGSSAGAARIYEFEVYNGAPGASAPAVLYAGQDATGRAQRFQSGAYDVLRGNLGVIGNDLARSLDVAPGYEVTLCRDAGLGGTCTTLAAGRYATLPAGLDLAVSSLRVRAVA
jgi:Domain of unknown function (DUF1929)/F5/8 type C domain/Galactose oxidase, central domain